MNFDQMNFDKMNFDNLPNSIDEFFSPQELKAMTEYETLRYRNLRMNFEALLRHGMTSPSKAPEFMLRKKKNSFTKSRARKPPPDKQSSDADSDEDWTPETERQTQSKVKRKGFCPPYKKSPSYKSPSADSATEPKVKKSRSNKSATQDVSSVEKPEVHKYPLRKNRATSYMSLNIPDDDEFLYCEECNLEYPGECPDHGALTIVEDSQVYYGDNYAKDLGIKMQKIGRATKAPVLSTNKLQDYNFDTVAEILFATQSFPSRTRFGPYGGFKTKDREEAQASGYAWLLFKDDKPSHYVDACDPATSNWMRYVNCARSEEEQNVTAYQFQGEIYYRSHKDIPAGTEILVYYGDNYAKDLGIKMQKIGRATKAPVLSANKPLDYNFDTVAASYSCPECCNCYCYPIFLQRHLWISHQYTQDQAYSKVIQLSGGVETGGTGTCTDVSSCIVDTEKADENETDKTLNVNFV